MAWQCCLGSIRIAGKAACDHRHANVSENRPYTVTANGAARVATCAVGQRMRSWLGDAWNAA
jgi:hypothetical protein